MSEKKEKFPSTFTVDNFSSTTKLASNEIKLPVGSIETINEKDDLYNPFDHRSAEHANTSLGSLVHLVKSSLGTGILAMPNAFKHGGLLFGFIGTIITGILCTHCVHVLVKASHKMSRLSKQPSMGFSETAEAVFKYGPKAMQTWSTTARYFVDISLVITYIMGNSVYIVFISESIRIVIDQYVSSNWDIRIYMALLLIPVVLSSQFRELKYLVPFSFFANVFMVVSFGITMYYLFYGLKIRDDLNLIGSVGEIPLFFSTVIFAMEGIGVVMPVENSMKKPQQFLGCPGVLNIAMIIVVGLYSIIGFFGYMRYGDKTEASITYNLPEEVLAQSAQVLIALAVFFTYALQFHVPMDILWRKVFQSWIPQKHHNISQFIIRTLAVCLTVCIAVVVPNLEPIIALVGSVCLSTLGIFIPAVVDTVMCWDGELGVFKWRLWKNIFLVLFSIFALVTGSYFAIQSLFSQS